LATQLGSRLEQMPDDEIRDWLEKRARVWAPFRSFVVANQGPLRKIATSSTELSWFLRYVDFITQDKPGPNDEKTAV
jgi:hypothetical protein